MFQQGISQRLRDTFESIVETSLSVTRYDIVLAVVPLAFALSVLWTILVGLPWRVGLTAASVFGLFAVADALFLHPPHSGPGVV